MWNTKSVPISNGIWHVRIKNMTATRTSIISKRSGLWTKVEDVISSWALVNVKAMLSHVNLETVQELMMRQAAFLWD